jgi:hypothetical protein
MFDLACEHGIWQLNCAMGAMQPTTRSSPTGLGYVLRLNSRLPCCSVLLLLLIAANAPAADLSMRMLGPPQNLAFARYIASLQKRDPFTESGPVLISVQASLPKLYKEAALLAVRELGENERGHYCVLQIGGDDTVTEEVIGRYFAVQEQIEALPASSILISPANYKFRFAAEVNTGGKSAYIYKIAPRKSRPGVITGQLWIDSDTGAEVMLTGHVRNASSIGGRADVVRDTKLLNGFAYARVTHLNFEVPRLGRGELIIKEYLLPDNDMQHPEPEDSQ